MYTVYYIYWRISFSNTIFHFPDCLREYLYRNVHLQVHPKASESISFNLWHNFGLLDVLHLNHAAPICVRGTIYMPKPGEDRFFLIFAQKGYGMGGTHILN